MEPLGDFSVDEVKAYLDGLQIKEILMAKEAELKHRQFDISHQLSIIKFLSEEKEMKYRQ